MRSSKIQLRKLKLRLRDKHFAIHRAPCIAIWQQPLQLVLALRDYSAMEKKKKRSYNKLCHQGLQQVCSVFALLYRTVARWVKAFKAECKNVSDMPRSGHPPVNDEGMHMVSLLLEMDQNFMIHIPRRWGVQIPVNTVMDFSDSQNLHPWEGIHFLNVKYIRYLPWFGFHIKL